MNKKHVYSHIEFKDAEMNVGSIYDSYEEEFHHQDDPSKDYAEEIVNKKYNLSCSTLHADIERLTNEIRQMRE
jgi:hypothetical protein